MSQRSGDPARQFKALLDTLARPSAFAQDAGVSSGDVISVIQTHASAVLLTETRAYKLKKPVNLEFLDYSTAERRRHFCIEECALNQLLAPRVYLGVAPVLSHPGEPARFGAVTPVDDLPRAGERIEGWEVVDFAVVMRRLPESRTLASLVNQGVADAALLQHVARVTASFHLAAENGTALAPYGTVETVLANIKQTIDQARADIGMTLTAEPHAAIEHYISRFIEQRRELLESRLRAGWVRDCHGDLRLEHVYAIPGDGPGGIELLIVDRIEFDPRFRYGDVAGEIAFPVVELERMGRPDLARAFTRAYIHETHDTGLIEVLPLYQVYRAMVRGKVRSILLRQPDLDVSERERARRDAVAMYDLAARYASSPIEPTVALIGGLMGSGKSTLARALHNTLGWPVLSSDILRKRMAGLPPTTPVNAGDQRSLYTKEWDRRVYDRLMEEGSALLAQGHSIVLDATFTRSENRRLMADLAREIGARSLFLECVCPREVAMSRLASRARAKQSLQTIDEERVAIFASDGRPEIYDRQAARWEPYDARSEPGMDHAVIDTVAPPTHQIERALEALNIPRLACWLD